MSPVSRNAVSRRVIRRLSAGAEGPGSEEEDAVAVEEPLEIRVAGEPLAVTMRSPGDDRALVLGFLFAEGLIEALDDIGTLAHCGRPGEEGFGNVVDVQAAPGTVIDAERLGGARRGTLTTSACGVCGRTSIDDLLARVSPLPPGRTPPLGSLSLAIERLAEAQPAFGRTGAVHGAVAVTVTGRRLVAAEDVGRHNAVDKVVGALVSAGLTGRGADVVPEEAPAVLAVSGRISFEIVQKALVARIPAVVGVSGPTSLAVDLARSSGLWLAGFARGGRLNLYSGGFSENENRPPDQKNAGAS